MEDASLNGRFHKQCSKFQRKGFVSAIVFQNNCKATDDNSIYF